MFYFITRLCKQLVFFLSTEFLTTFSSPLGLFVTHFGRLLTFFYARMSRSEISGVLGQSSLSKDLLVYTLWFMKCV